MLRNRRSMALALLLSFPLSAGVSARAEDASLALDEVLRAADEKTAADATSVDAALETGDPQEWEKARARYLEGLAAASTAIERALLLAAGRSAPELPIEAVQRASRFTGRLSTARLLYSFVSERAHASPDADARRKAFDRLRATPGLAATLLRDPAALWGQAATAEIARKAKITKSVNHIRVLVTILLADNPMADPAPFPRFDGKRFILSLVARNVLDWRDPRNLAVLFSPGDETRSVEKAGGPSAYEGVTLAALRGADLDVSKLTSYAGRRNAHREFALTVPDLERGAPLIADLSFPDVAIVGLSNGAVKVMTRADLGLGSEDPIAVGDTSKSPVLRVLSDE